MWSRVERWVEKNEWWLLAAISAAVLRIPSLLEPYWYGDEGIYLTIGRAINSGVKLYSQIHDNKPPLLYWAAALANGQQFWFRLEALTVNIATIVVFSKLATKIFDKDNQAKQTTVWLFVLLTCLPFWEGNIANAELFFLLPAITAVCLLWDTKGSKRIFLAGLAIGIAGLFKVPAILEMGIWPLVWLREDKHWAKKTWILGIGTVLPLLISVGWFYFQGTGKDYLTAAWAQNIPYLTSWKPSGGAAGIFSIKIRAIIALGISLLLVWKYKELGKRAVIIGIWGTVTLFAALMSGRPYPHYLLQMAGALAAAGGLLLSKNKTKEQTVSLGLAGILIISWVSFKFYVYPTASYYTNFAKWVWGKENKQQYYAHFNQNLDDLYNISGVVKTNTSPQDRIFVWGDIPMVYALTERNPATKYMVEYHIKDFNAEKFTLNQLEENLPKYIIVADRQNELPGLKGLLNSFYLLEKKTPGYDIYKLSRILSKWISL